MSVKSASSVGEPASGQVVRMGYLKKLKTMRKKYFVLRAETPDTSARLEYYDSEKKFRSSQTPKRSISLKACFNINKRVDTKHKHVIALYTKDDCFCVVLESERDLDDWLKSLLSLQHGEDVVDGEPPKPTFEHVWQVTMLNKGLGSSRNIIGAYHLCFTDKTLSLVRKSTNIGGPLTGNVNIGGHPDHVEFTLMSIRRCGHSECFFYIEVGRSAVTGAGELWMQTDDSNIAQNMGEVILRAMSNNNKEDLAPKPRTRSSSANEASKPILVQRRQTHAGGQKSNIYCSPSQGMGGRERCDSMPSRARTTSEGNPAMSILHPIRAHLVPHRPQSLYGREISHSPPAGSPISPASAACSTDSAGSSLSIDEPDAWTEYTDMPMGRLGHSLTPDEPIVEENCDEGTDNPYVLVSPTSGSPITGGYVPMAPLSSDDGYVDMSPRGRHTDMSPAASTCSITSGTPSTDMRFSEYHLEKVSSYFTPSEEDDTSSAERPLRAYSVGSRPEALKLKSKLELQMGNHENARVRAFSCGSRSKGIHNRVLPPHGHPPSTGGAKSSSAPLLSSSQGHSGSHSSMERMDDLMEMDFSKPSSNPGYVDMSPRGTRSVPSGYVEMKPGVSNDYTTPTTPDLPYMDMRPSTTTHLDTVQREQHPYVDMRPGPATSPLKPSVIPGSSVSSRDSGYMDMRPSTSPHKPSSIPKHNQYYVEMSGSSKLGTSPKNNKAASPIQEEYIDMDFKSSRNNNRTLSGAARTQPVDFPHPKKTNDGYMEMSWSKHQRKSSLDSAKVNSVNNDDYINMSARKKDRRGSKKEKVRSQPITIQTPSTSAKTSQSPGSSGSYYQPSGPKNSDTTPKHPPNYLPIKPSSYSPTTSPYSSLRRPRRKSSRRDSKDSTNSGVVTPTSESTIFPFSPGSPTKSFQTKSPDFTAAPRKCAVDASSGTVKITNSTAAKPPQSGGSDYVRMSYDFTNHHHNSSDYADMNFDKKSKTTANNETDLDYVNFCPAVPKQRNISGSSDDYGEYAVMRPISMVPNNDTAIRRVTASNTITKQLSSMNIKPVGFKPITEDNRLGAVSPRPGDVAPHKSFENLRTDQDASALEGTSRSECADGGAYETLRTTPCISPIAKIPRPGSVQSDKSSVTSDITKGSLSRPSSVSSELGSTTSTIIGPNSRPESVNADLITRPSSVSSERELHYASLDLAPTEDDGTRSPRNVVRPGQDGTRSPTPNSMVAEPAFQYAEIDFIRSEGLKQQNSNNAKVKH